MFLKPYISVDFIYNFPYFCSGSRFFTPKSSYFHIVLCCSPLKGVIFYALFWPFPSFCLLVMPDSGFKVEFSPPSTHHSQAA